MTPPPPSCPMHRRRTTTTTPSLRPSGSTGAAAATRNQDWWPDQLDLTPLRRNEQHYKAYEQARRAYVQRFAKLDLPAVEHDLEQLMTNQYQHHPHHHSLPQVDGWPADYGHYGPLLIRLAWHAAGTHRTCDGRGGAGSGQIRFAPLNSWPDNANLDKARRLLWPVKQKYGHALSWADLFILAGNVALQSMGMKPLYGFAGGRVDVDWPMDDRVDWGSEQTWLAANRQRYPSESSQREALAEPFGAVQMGLIYVNPEGPNGVPDPLASARDIRETFRRMAMNDEETVALIAGGHTFGKCHGAGDPKQHVGPEPEAAPIEAQGLGWKNSFKTGSGGDTITSGLEGAWTEHPTRWDNGYFDLLWGYDWELTKSPAGAQQWTPKNYQGQGVVDAHDKNKRHKPIMLTSDLALRMDPGYAKISKYYHANSQAFQQAFAKAWYKLTHRDMGPVSRCVGPNVPPPQPWQDPVPPLTYPTIFALHHQQWLKRRMLTEPKLSPTKLVSVAWASASSFRQSDKRGGANGGRLCLAPQKDWDCNKGLEPTAAALKKIQQQFNSQFAPVQVSMADLIVLGGCAAIEAAAPGKEGAEVSFIAGRTDATQAMTDVESFAVLEPIADGFRNYLAEGVPEKPEVLLVETADRLALTAREMTVLVGGLRSLGVGGPTITRSTGHLDNSFFVNLLDNSVEWKEQGNGNYQGFDRKTGRLAWPQASRIDLIFGSHSVLRGLAESYAVSDSQKVFVRDFCAAFAKVMNLDRFDLDERLISRL